MKVVQFFGGHNFMSNGISNFEWKRMKNLVNCQQLLFTETEWHSKFGSKLCKTRGENIIWPS
jgi:hypothetical protein